MVWRSCSKWARSWPAMVSVNSRKLVGPRSEWMPERLRRLRGEDEVGGAQGGERGEQVGEAGSGQLCPGILVVPDERWLVLGQDQPGAERVGDLGVPQVAQQLGRRPLVGLRPSLQQLVGQAAGLFPDRLRRHGQHGDRVLPAQQGEQLLLVLLWLRHRVGLDDPLLHYAYLSLVRPFACPAPEAYVAQRGAHCVRCTHLLPATQERLRLRSVLPSGPRTEPNPTCSAWTGSRSQPASRAAWKTIS